MADASLTIRRASEQDQQLLRELWEEFEHEVPEPGGIEPETWDEEWSDTLDDIHGGGVFIAEDGEGPVGVARIEAPVRGAAHVQLVYVRERGRRRGITKALLAECVADARERGARTITLEVVTANRAAVSVWKQLGFTEYAYVMGSSIDALESHLTDPRVFTATGTTHVQSDDELSVSRAIEQFVPRLESPDVRPGESWIRIADPALDRERDAHERFARELSERLGAVTVALRNEGDVVRFLLYERGSMVDEYLSVPSYYGHMSKGDELALAANPTLVARLTGADRDAVRRVARTAESPAELPPAAELYGEIARVLGLDP